MAKNPESKTASKDSSAATGSVKSFADVKTTMLAREAEMSADGMDPSDISAIAQRKSTDVLDFMEAEGPQRVLIIGGTGSLGNHLTAAMRSRRSIHISILSRDENKQWHMRRLYPEVEFLLGDMRDPKRLRDVLGIVRPTIVILAGALKHIDQCEAQVDECIATNITGVGNVVRACVDHAQANASHALKTVLFISTDKACSPVNVYGMSKALSERVVTQVPFKYAKVPGMPKFIAVRYGNVLNSRGSIIPRFVELAADPSTVSFPITDVRMTRFFMTLDQSIELIFHAIVFGRSGETWIPRVPAVRIVDLVRYFADGAKKPVDVVGVRPGEKIHECLINDAESHRMQKRTIQATGGKSFYVVASCLDSGAKAEHDLTGEYTSEAVSDFSVLLPLIREIAKQPPKH